MRARPRRCGFWGSYAAAGVRVLVGKETGLPAVSRGSNVCSRRKAEGFGKECHARWEREERGMDSR